MNRRRVLPALAVMIVASHRGDRLVGAMAFGTVPHAPDRDADCKQMASTGRAVARRCADGRSEAHVDNRITVHLPQYPPRFRHLPIDRLRARGEGKIHAAGDKGARRELRSKAHRRH